MNNNLNYNIDFVFIITPHILLKHNNYLYQNIKNDNYFIETLIYDHTDPLNEQKNYYFTLQKILKIAILRKYTNIMIIRSDILFKNNWLNILNSILNTELRIINNNFSLIWLQSEQEYFTDYQLNEINNKQYYRFNLTHDKNNNMTSTYGTNGIIISENIYIKLYYHIKQTLESNNISDFNNILSSVCNNSNSFIIYPNLIINIEKIEPLYFIACKLLLNKEKKNLVSNNYNFLNPVLKTLVIETNNIQLINNLKDNISDLNYLKQFTDQEIIDEIEEKNENLVKIYNDYIIPYKLCNNIYNPNHFNIYHSFNKDIINHFDWIFYKYYYDDLINNDTILNFDDAMTHYLNNGYKELRFICIDEYLYDKHDSELNEQIKQIDIELIYQQNKKQIDEKNLSKKPIIYYIKYIYNHISIV